MLSKYIYGNAKRESRSYLGADVCDIQGSSLCIPQPVYSASDMFSVSIIL